LIAPAEIRHGVFCARVIARSRRIAAAKIDHGGGEGQLIRITEHIAVGPAHAGAAAQVAGIRGIDGNRVAQTLSDLECDGHPSRIVHRGADRQADLTEHPQSQQVMARPLDGGSTVAIAGMQREHGPQQGLVRPLQSLKMNLAYVHLGSHHGVKTQVEHGRIRGLVSNRRIHRREGVSLVLHRSQHACACRKHH
jgi:hypothetical protein